ncbi:MAG TPA: hypothetical protein VGV88_06260 [Candidatus Dormibacteraeota bacterium]|nr:hypothetical protein [Candidatus Dormibacteraeota bacterium]
MEPTPAPPPAYYYGQPVVAPTPPARGSSRRLWTILTAIAIVAFLLVIAGGYGIAGYVTAGGKIGSANSAIDGVASHRSTFDSAPSTFDIQRSDAKAFQSDAAAWVQTWTSQSSTIADDEAALAAAGAKLQDQQWLTAIRKGSLDSAAARVDHASKAMAAAKTVAVDRLAEGKFLVAYANFLNDVETYVTKEQSGDALGALATANLLPAEADKAVSLASDPQFPSELAAYTRSESTIAKDLVDYLNAVIKGDAATAKTIQDKTNADIDASQLIDISKVGTKIDQFYQPLLDTYHKELTLAAGG